MSKKTSTNMMKIMGATLAVCSAAAIMGGMKTSNSSAKKTMKKAGEKVVEFVDTEIFRAIARKTAVALSETPKDFSSGFRFFIIDPKSRRHGLNYQSLA